MTKKSNKELITILVLTVAVGIAGFFFATRIDTTIARVSEIRIDVDELTRYAINQEERIKEVQAVDDYTEVLEGNLPHSEDIISILEQIEAMSVISKTELNMKLEEGSISEGKLDFTNQKERDAFLKSLTFQEYIPSEESTESSDQPVNIALQFAEEKQTQTTGLKINYIGIDLTLHGTYEDIREFISLLHSSKYLFNVKEMRLNKTTNGDMEANLTIRAFIFED